MALLSIYRSNPEAILSMTIEQIVNLAGDGKLKDGSECSMELRSLLSQIDNDKLAEYTLRCLTDSFNKSGLVLQDLVNELGRRLDYVTVNGRYQGTTNAVGYDGLWTSPEGHNLLIEVKTTDAYRLSLDTIAQYRERLRQQGELNEPNSMLIVVGREDTGELEAQVRGSRHAWDMRLISIESLIHLVKLKESTDEPSTGSKIRSLLVPREYTRVDELIDVIFTATKDVESGAEEGKQPESGETNEGAGWDFTDRHLLDDKRTRIMSAFAGSQGVNLIKRSRALYWTPDHRFRAGCTISKRYEVGAGGLYWYAYHPRWNDFLADAEKAFFVLGGMDLNVAFAIPLDVIKNRLNELNLTPLPDGKSYWHIKIMEPAAGEYLLQMPRSGNHLSLKSYAFQI